jgi:hypothetical protein
MSNTTSGNYMKVATEFGSNSPRTGNLSFQGLGLSYSDCHRVSILVKFSGQ